MKHKYTFVILCILLFTITRAFSQVGSTGSSNPPLKEYSIPMFGKDIVIHEQPDRDQRNVAICSAFNGWLFAVYWYNIPIGPQAVILKSVDNGITWEVLFDGNAGNANSIIKKMEIATTGNSVSNMKVFLAIAYHGTTSNTDDAICVRYNADPWVPEGFILDTYYDVRDLALACDNIYPAANANPNSIALLYSTYNVRDSLIFISSNDGGITFDNYEYVVWSPKIICKVALSYGYSPAMNTGRYFAAWEVQDEVNSNLGHIYTAHTGSDINGPFTPPFCLDSLDALSINKCRNPIIACQTNSTDNDSANLSEVVIFEKYIQATNSYELQGYYNLRATLSNYFQKFSVPPPLDIKIQPDISFNSFNSEFMLTYFDSTSGKLPYLTHDFNMVDPDIWNVVNPGYNDNNYMFYPHPQIELNYSEHEGMNVWTSNRSDGKGVALYDAQYSTYTGASESNGYKNVRLIGTYPNPCATYTNIKFELQDSEYVTIVIYNSVGQSIKHISPSVFASGYHQIYLPVSEFAPGIYYYSLNTKYFETLGRFIVIR